MEVPGEGTGHTLQDTAGITLQHHRGEGGGEGGRHPPIMPGPQTTKVPTHTGSGANCLLIAYERNGLLASRLSLDAGSS